jgi:hypothetical protein
MAPHHGNCFFVIVRQWRAGGFFVITRSKSSPLIPHVMWTPHLPGDTQIVHFQPVNRQWGWRKFFHKFWFRGRWISESYAECKRRLVRERSGAPES